MKDYIKQALRSDGNYENMEKRCNKDSLRILHAAIGLSSESAEVLDIAKKFLTYGKTISKDKLIEELGDIFWYSALLCDTLDISFEEVQKLNIAKLNMRYGKGHFSESSAIAQRDHGFFHAIGSKLAETYKKVTARGNTCV